MFTYRYSPRSVPISTKGYTKLKHVPNSTKSLPKLVHTTQFTVPNKHLKRTKKNLYQYLKPFNYNNYYYVRNNTQDKKLRTVLQKLYRGVRAFDGSVNIYTYFLKPDKYQIKNLSNLHSKLVKLVAQPGKNNQLQKKQIQELQKRIKAITEAFNVLNTHKNNLQKAIKNKQLIEHAFHRLHSGSFGAIHGLNKSKHPIHIPTGIKTKFTNRIVNEPKPIPHGYRTLNPQRAYFY